MTVSPDGSYVYVGEIGPNRVSRFSVVKVKGSRSAKTVELNLMSREEMDESSQDITSPASALTTGMIILIGMEISIEIRCTGLLYDYDKADYWYDYPPPLSSR